MWILKAVIVPLLVCVTIVKVTDADRDRRKCPKGWNKFCEDENKCVKPMTEFDSTRMCLRRGGIPGVIVCLKRDSFNVTEQIERMCIKDLKNGKFGFAKNLRNAMAQVDKEEAEAEEDNLDENGIEEFEAPLGDLSLTS